MDHNDFDFYDDLTTPLFHFFMNAGLDLDAGLNERFPNGKPSMPKRSFIPPLNILKKE